MHAFCLVWRERITSYYTWELFKVIGRKVFFKLKAYFAKNDILGTIVTHSRPHLTSEIFRDFFSPSIGNLMCVKQSED